MTTQATVQQEEQVKFLTPSSASKAGVPVPPATLATIETDGEKIVAIWLGGMGESHQDAGAEFIAIQKEPETVSDVAEIALNVILASLTQQEIFVAPYATLRDAGFTFTKLLPGQSADVKVA